MVEHHFVAAELARRRRANELREPAEVTPDGEMHVLVDGRRLVNFSSNDYLGLARHPLLRERAAEYAVRWGNGATASRVLAGNHPGYAAVEERLATLKGSEKAMVLNSGYQANVTLLPELADRHTLLLADRLNHNSLVQGAVLSRAVTRRYRHGDLDHLRTLLEQNCGSDKRRVVIATESLFSMDGDRSDIPALIDLASEFEAFLYIDDAHATGLFGSEGMGIAGGDGVDLVMGTFSKACGAFGAYIACSSELYDYLFNRCGGVVYSTALPPAALGAIDAVLDVVPTMGAARQRLQAAASRLRESLRQQGWSTGLSTTHIVPVIVGAAQEALDLSRWMQEQGVLAAAVRPPTVPSGQARLRLCLSAAHTRDQVDRVVQLLGDWRRRQGAS